MDETSAAWVAHLRPDAVAHDATVRELHRLLVRVALAECARRNGTHGLSGRELTDLGHQAADDAVMSVLRRLEDFRGDSRFTTWACAFVIREVTTKVGRHVWRRDGVSFDAASWERLPERLGHGPETTSMSRALVLALEEGMAAVLTEHQRGVFAALVLHGSPVDAVAAELGTTRGAVYKTMYDARVRLRAHLVRCGFLDGD